LDHKAPDAFRTISEVAQDLELPQHVLRFWESRFREIRPMKRGGGRRYYRPDDIDLLRGIRHLLYGEGYTIRGVQRILREQGPKFVQAVWQDGAPQPPHGAAEIDQADEGDERSMPALEERRGLLGRLIGRDLNEREDAGERDDPPLHSAPMPRIDPADRPGHAVARDMSPAREEQDEQQDADDYRPESSPVRSAPPVGGRALSSADVGRLHAALHELGECRKLIEAALTRD
jgi:DNA-binding transcriptional MerR regulator